MFVVSAVSLVATLSDRTKMLFFAPGGVFELVLGVWLLVRGGKTSSTV
ncbi:MAG: hypothetical protein KF894_10060 [Labilithrix sp.]|nr:hypothetical protein [Labilithrix sp.]